MPGKRYTFVLNFGYVESARMTFMPWASKQSFKDVKTALLDLATFLLEAYLADLKVPLKKCCKLTKTKDESAVYCSQCACRIGEAALDVGQYCGWLRSLDTDTDSFHGMIPWDQDARWQTGDLEGAPNQRFVYQAEWVLAAAVGHSIRNDISFEDVCKARTKSRSESFSYY